MATVKDALSEIKTHEKECAIRYQNIEKRLDEGSEARMKDILTGQTNIGQTTKTGPKTRKYAVGRLSFYRGSHCFN